METRSAPQECIEAWAEAYVLSQDLAHKLAPPPPPRRFADDPAPVRLAGPGRPPELRVAPKAKRSVRREQLRLPRWRAHILHGFFHHELQAAELMCWAILAFPQTPAAFRRGLLKICRDEIRHMNAYRRAIAALGFAIGEFPVRDWIWTRVRTCATPVQFVALLGLGLEGGNLDHAVRFAARFREVGDEASARVQDVVGREEIGHVRFAGQWFAHWTGGLDFARWCEELPPPLTPELLRGHPLNRDARAAAGLPAEFLDALEKP